MPHESFTVFSFLNNIIVLRKAGDGIRHCGSTRIPFIALKQLQTALQIVDALLFLFNC